MRVSISHLVLFLIAASYVFLGLAEPDQARALWAPYAVVTFVLAIYNVAGDFRRGWFGG